MLNNIPYSNKVIIPSGFKVHCPKCLNELGTLNTNITLNKIIKEQHFKFTKPQKEFLNKFKERNRPMVSFCCLIPWGEGGTQGKGLFNAFKGWVGLVN